MKPIAISLFMLVAWTALQSQTHAVRGRVIDADTRMPLPFVNIVINDSNIGGTTDIDGKFSFQTHVPIRFLKLSYVGYEMKVVEPDKEMENLVITLKKTEYELPEFVVYPTENPAHRIIGNAIASRRVNDPEQLPAFTYTAYDKMIFTFELDSLPRIDTLKVDTASESFRNFLEEHHLFMMESVAERKYKYPGKNEEKVIATKVSGFKDPIFVFLISQWQSTTFYSDQIQIAGKNYVNPVSPGSLNKYFFLLQDTLYYGEQDTVFIISYRPRVNTGFDGLTGTLSINTRKWAVQNVIAEPFGSTSNLVFRIEQMYELIDGEHWFPVQINNLAILKNVHVTDSTVSMGVNLGGEVPDSLKSQYISLPIGSGKRYIRNIDLNPEVRNREFGNTEVEVDPNATFRNEAFWNVYRVDSLTFKERNTYRYIDSLGQAENFDRAAKTIESLFTGKIPWGIFDIDIHRFLRYNSYEGLAPGLGLHTNQRLSEVFSAGGYFRYGFKDKEFKYGGDASLLLWNRADFSIGLAYLKDVMETSGVTFWDEKPFLINAEYFRDFMVRQMDDVVEVNTGIDFRTLKFLNVHLGLAATHKTVTNGYQYGISGEEVNVYFDEFDFTEMRIGLRYAYGEKFVKNMRKKISLGTNYPIFWIQYARGIEGLLAGDFNYNRYDFKVEKSLTTNYIGKTTLRLNAGFIDSDIPYTNLYNGNGAYREFTIYAPYSFTTMRMNEFLSNKYIAFYFTHDFEKLLFRGNLIKPEVAIATNLAFGWLDFTQSHYNITYSTMDKGYYESGLLVNNLVNLKIYSLGLGAFYHYGPYSYPNAWDNVGLRFTLKVKFTL